MTTAHLGIPEEGRRSGQGAAQGLPLLVCAKTAHHQSIFHSPRVKSEFTQRQCLSITMSNIAKQPGQSNSNSSKQQVRSCLQRVASVNARLSTTSSFARAKPKIHHDMADTSWGQRATRTVLRAAGMRHGHAQRHAVALNLIAAPWALRRAPCRPPPLLPAAAAAHACALPAAAAPCAVTTEDDRPNKPKCGLFQAMLSCKQQGTASASSSSTCACMCTACSSAALHHQKNAVSGHSLKICNARGHVESSAGM